MSHFSFDLHENTVVQKGRIHTVWSKNVDGMSDNLLNFRQLLKNDTELFLNSLIRAAHLPDVGGRSKPQLVTARL